LVHQVLLILGALTAVGLMSIWIPHEQQNGRDSTRTLMQEVEGSITFLFEDETLVDATPLRAI
jgi:hypothetical protein